MFGKDRPVALTLLDIEPCLGAVEGVVMELEDCAYPLLHSLCSLSPSQPPRPCMGGCTTLHHDSLHWTLCAPLPLLALTIFLCAMLCTGCLLLQVWWELRTPWRPSTRSISPSWWVPSLDVMEWSARICWQRMPPFSRSRERQSTLSPLGMSRCVCVCVCVCVLCWVFGCPEEYAPSRLSWFPFLFSWITC